MSNKFKTYIQWIYIYCYWTVYKERIQKFKETGDSRYIYQNELDKTCFHHDMAYGYFKYLTRTTVSDKILHDKAFKLQKIRNMIDINGDINLLQWSLIFLIKKTSGGAIKN